MNFKPSLCLFLQTLQKVGKTPKPSTDMPLAVDQTKQQPKKGSESSTSFNVPIQQRTTESNAIQIPQNRRATSPLFLALKQLRYITPKGSYNKK